MNDDIKENIEENIIGFDALYNSMEKCRKGVIWKDSVAHYYLNGIEETLKLEEQLKTGTYKERKPVQFTIMAPKKREIVSIAFRDRVYQRSLNDSGVIVAGVFHKSKKTESGSLKSVAGAKGLCKKGMILLCVLIAYRLDLATGVDYIREAVIIGFMSNELISIVENAGLMGVPMPAAITKAIDVLQSKGKKE